MTTDLVPSSSAAHGITLSQNVARDVAERIDELRSGTRRTRVGMFVAIVAPAAGIAALASINGALAFCVGLFALYIPPFGIGVHLYRRKALKQAELLDRTRDVSWVSGKDGLVFFGDDGFFIEKRGGFKPYGANTRRFHDVTFAAGLLRLTGWDSRTGAHYGFDIGVPHGWTEADTLRVREKVNAFAQSEPS